MNKQHLKMEIETLLETLNEQYEAVKNRNEKIPQIELDILMNNVRNLYEILLRLNKVNNPPVPESIKESVSEAKVEKSISEKFPSQPELSNIQASATVEANEESLKDIEPLAEAAAPQMEQKIVEERAKVISKSVKQVSANGSLFEEETVTVIKSGQHTTIHDRLSKTKEDKTLGDKLHDQPMDDLKKSIGINEKFKFMNELFDGSLSDYTKSIDFLNNCKSFAEAENFIEQTLIPKYGWNKDSEIYQSLLFLIHRKFQ